MTSDDGRRGGGGTGFASLAGLRVALLMLAVAVPFQEAARGEGLSGAHVSEAVGRLQSLPDGWVEGQVISLPERRPVEGARVTFVRMTTGGDGKEE